MKGNKMSSTDMYVKAGAIIVKSGCISSNWGRDQYTIAQDNFDAQGVRTHTNMFVNDEDVAHAMAKVWVGQTGMPVTIVSLVWNSKPGTYEGGYYHCADKYTYTKKNEVYQKYAHCSCPDCE